MNPDFQVLGPDLNKLVLTLEAPLVPAPVAGKISGALYAAIQEDLSGNPDAVPVVDSNPLRNLAKRSSTGDIEIIVEVSTWSATVLDDLAALGVETTLSNESLKMAQGWARASEIDTLLTDVKVKRVSLPNYPVLNTGAETTEGDGIQRSDDVRSVFAGLGIDGTGIKVGVISDGVQNRATVDDTGDLPTQITVNPSLPGSGDEGTAMLEIIHDIAPGAQLFFSSGLNGTLAMINSVNWMVSQGVDIIVDDPSFFGEPYFGDGTVADAVADAVEAGVSYFSAAGNQALDHYQDDFDLGGFSDTLTSTRQEIHDFGAGDISLGVALQGDGVPGVSGGLELNVFLQWSDPYGASDNDYNLFLVDQFGNVVASSELQQTGTQNPVEQLALDFDGPGTFTGFLVIGREVGSDDRELELFVLNDVQHDALHG